jgi:hypothetical protein
MPFTLIDFEDRRRWSKVVADFGESRLHLGVGVAASGGLYVGFGLPEANDNHLVSAAIEELDGPLVPCVLPQIWVDRLTINKDILCPQEAQRAGAPPVGFPHFWYNRGSIGNHLTQEKESL